MRYEEEFGLWWKYTNPGYSGSTVDWDGQSRPTMRMATPLEYLERLDEQNQTFADDVQLRGLWLQAEKGGWRIITTQPHVAGGTPTPEQLHNAMTDWNYELLPYADLGRYGALAYRKGHQAVWDVHPVNATLTRDGLVVPYDFIITKAP